MSRESPGGWRELTRRRRAIPFSIMRSNGGVLSADEVVEQPISTVLSGPAAGALGAATIAATPAIPLGADLRRRRHLHRRHGDQRRPTVADHRGLGRRRSRPRSPMIDVVTVGAGGGSVAWISPEGTLKVGPAVGRRRPGTGLLPARRHRSRPSPTRIWCSAGSRRTCSAARSPLDTGGGRRGDRRAGRRPRAGPRGVRRRHSGDLGLEPGECAAPDHHRSAGWTSGTSRWSPSAAPVRCWPAG